MMRSGFLKKYIMILMIFALFFTALCGCGRQEAAIDPYEGMVQVADGRGGLMWVEPHESVPVNDMVCSDFYIFNGNVFYAGNEYQVLRGVDVSFYQGDIDWEAVKADGIEFALIRVGYRGYSEGGIFEDEKFRDNIAGAAAAGLQIGVYFFSQAVTPQEAVEEAQFVLELIDGYEIGFPVAFDWERIDGDEQSRTYNVPGETVTDCCLSFCDTVSEAGYEPAVYFYRDLGYKVYELDRLAGLKFWVGAVGGYPDFYYEHHIWQYSFTGSVSGIEGTVDINLCFIEVPSDENEDTPE